MSLQIQIPQPPRTIMELFKMLPEGTLAELIDNSIYMSPAPTTNHQRVLNKLNYQIFDYLEENSLGEIFIAPVDVYFDQTSNAVQPDLVIILSSNKDIKDEDGVLNGIPDILVEILSSGNKDFDLIKKKALYEKFGVKEYIIVDPETKLAITFNLSSTGIYQKIDESISTASSILLNRKFSF